MLVDQVQKHHHEAMLVGWVHHHHGVMWVAWGQKHLHQAMQVDQVLELNRGLELQEDLVVVPHSHFGLESFAHVTEDHMVIPILEDIEQDL